MSADCVLKEMVADGVGLIRLNRPEAYNALSMELIRELAGTLADLDADESVRAIVLTGNEKAFAAGADLKEMSTFTPMRLLTEAQFALWDQIAMTKKPLIAAVSGYALGGGCEVAMMCDMIVASESARFGQPEVTLGTIPGAGGTQRLTRAVGKALAMEVVLANRWLTAEEALAHGLVNRVVPVERYLEESIALATKIASFPPVAVQLAKQSIIAAFQTPLSEGLRFERHNFYLTFASEDQKEGMLAFLEKRSPQWLGR